MIAPMFWNLCKSSWRKGHNFLLLGVISLLLVQDGENANIERLRCGTLYKGHSLKYGKEAGLFNKYGIEKHGATDTLDKCVESCCEDRDCETALFVGKLRSCYSVNCKTSTACTPVPTLWSSKNYAMSIFHKNSTVPGDSKSKTSLNQHESCHHYHGHHCTKHLNHKLLYFTKYPPLVEKTLLTPLNLLKNKLSPTCEPYALAAICYYAFPYCADKSRPSPTYLCREDCQLLYSNVCEKEFHQVKDVIKRILPDCDKLPPAGSPGALGCISLNISETLLPPRPLNPPPTSSTSSTAIYRKTEKHNEEKSENDEEDLNLFKQQINEPKSKSKIIKSQQITDGDNSKHQNKDRTDNVDNLEQNGEEPTNVEPSNVEPSNVEPTIVEPTIVEPSNVEPTIVEPTIVEPTIVEPTNVEPTIENTNSNERLAGETNGQIPPTETTVPQGNNEQTVKPTRYSITSHKLSSSINSTDEDIDLNTPKINKIPDKEKETGKSGEDDHEEDDGRAQDLPTVSSTKPLGLGLQESMGLLEPTPTRNGSLKRDNITTTKSSSSDEDTLHASTSKTYQPTFVNVSNVDADETNFAVTDKSIKRHETIPTTKTPAVTNSTLLTNLSTSAVPTKPGGHSATNGSATSAPTQPVTEVPSKSTKPPTEAPPTLQVSAGQNKVLTLPHNSIELYASAYPKETLRNPYTYHWQQISAPQDSHGYMEGKDTRRVILSKLSHVGVYQFKVTVKGTINGALGFALVNVTVRPAPRVNKPPRADISPKEQTITLPTNEVVLDGSKSSDDDKITQYKWEEVKGPLNDKNKMIVSGADTPVLQLKSLVPGIYTFKLTVVDSDDEKDSTTATVTVNDEKDYPPVARAGNDVVLTLPVDRMTVNGNSSTDDKGIVSYEWSKAPSSPAVGDMQGTNSPFLKVSNMVVGDYTFILKVTDSGGQTASSKVTVVIQPEKNTPPVAKAGSDKDLVYPDDSTTLDSKGSHDDQKIIKYHWAQESGPSNAEISGVDEKVATVRKLQEGHYVFKLTVTDDKGLAGTDTVAVNVKKDINQSPVASAGPDVVVHLPNRAAELDGSKSSDDHEIAEYIWYRDPKSPAAGDVINKSNHQAVLRLSNLVEGLYKFKLTVLDAKGLKSSDEALLTVKEDENSAHLVELYLDVDITRFTEENKGQLIRKLAVILDVQDDDIVVEHLKEAGTGHSMMVMFYVKSVGNAKDGQAVAEMLKAKIENEEGFFEFRMLKVEPYICRNNCSFHGYCDRRTKLCVCESFWMQNIFRSSFGVKESNCEWSILYVTVIIFGIVMGIGGIIWAVCFCMGRRRRRTRRRHRYAIIDEEDDDDKAESMEMLPKGKYSSMMLSDSDEDSDETTVFEAKKRIPNGTLNGSVGRKAM